MGVDPGYQHGHQGYPQARPGAVFNRLFLYLQPVSYTHLDVYKRQILNTPASAPAPKAPCDTRRFPVAETEAASPCEPAPSVRRIEPVSYTHRDVYKRQPPAIPIEK